jgi:hypothetical protein
LSRGNTFLHGNVLELRQHRIYSDESLLARSLTDMNPLVNAAIAKAGDVVAEVAKKEADSFLQATLGEPLKAVGGLLADHINVRRHANLIKAVVNAKQQLSQAGVAPKEVPLSIIHPAIEAASLEEDPDMQVVWANLLANAADPRRGSPLLPSFPGILKDLVSRDAKFLAALHAQATGKARRPNTRSSISAVGFTWDDLLNVYADAGLSREQKLTVISVRYYADHKEALEADFEEFELTLNVALRHNILTVDESPMPIKIGNDKNYRIPPKLPDVLEVEFNVTYSFTRFGCAFIAACQPVKENPSADANT